MVLTIEQILQKAMAAHQEGKLQDAERLYRAILQSQPMHPDANHNLGVLAVLGNETGASLPLFKTALRANPKKEQFWFSYIDALIKEQKFEAAKQVIEQVKSKGMAAAKLQIFEEQLQSNLSPRSDIPQQEFGNPLQSHQDELLPAIELREVGKYKEAKDWLSKVIEHDSKNPEALSLLSQVLLLDKKEAEAERVLAAAASINSELPSVYRNQARLLLKQSKTAEALEKAQLGCKQSPEDSESLLVLAACLGANQRDLEALPLVEKILKAESNYAEAYANRALIRLRAKDKTGAIEDAEMTVSLKPHLTQMWQLLSSLHYQANNLSDAIEALRRAHKNEPENPDFMIQLGEFLRQDNKVSEAITILERATELAPKDSTAWTNLGVAFQQEKRIADAKIAYEKALALNPKSAAIASTLGAMAKEAQAWESALQYFAKALEIEPNLAEAHSNLGNVLKELGRLDEAEASYNEAIELKPDYAEVHSNLGNTLQELGRLDEAEASYRQAIALKPDLAEVHSNLGNTLEELGRLDEALASCAQAIALKPDYAEAHYNLGVTLKELGRLDEALASYTQAIALKPDYAEAHNNLGAALKEMGRLEGAEASYNQAIALKSDYVEVHYNLGITLQELGRLDEAEASLRQAIALKPNHADAHSQLGINSYSKGNIDAAIESLKKARDIDPKSGLSSLVLPVLRARKARESTEVGFDNKKKADHDLELSSNPLRLNRVVEPELVSALLEMQSRDMDKARNTPVFGNGRCSLDYNMFDVSSPIIKAVEKDLVNLLEAAFKSKIYLADSFFNIYAAGAGIPPHTHLAELDKNEYLSLAKQKFSLVYYLSVGDQDCSEPGVFKLYDPEEEILPCDGMILIIPAGRRHSAVYGGKKDRVIIGINFYSL